MKTTEIDAQEADALKAIYMAKRKELNITYMDLESILGVSHAAVGHFMTGRLRLDLTKGLLISHTLNCKLEDFSPRLAGEWSKLCDLVLAQGKDLSHAPPTVAVIETKDATDKHPKTLTKISKPSPDFVGFYVVVADDMMADASPRSIPKGSMAAVNTQHTKLKDGNIYLVCSPNWETPIIREAKNVAGRWKLISKNEKLGLESEWHDNETYRIIGQIKGVTSSI